MPTPLTVLQGDALALLRTLPDESIQCCVCSPPYYGLRRYLPPSHPDAPAEIGTEPTPDAYVARLCAVFREVRRLLHGTGLLWLNLGDCYLRKQLQGMPWRVAFALQADGWLLRSDCIWHKSNATPSSAKDRCTTAHEYVFMFAKRERYYFDAQAIKEPCVKKGSVKHLMGGHGVRAGTRGALHANWDPARGRNKRSVWTCATQPTPDAFFATMPEAVIRPCILAGSRPGDVVMDCFAGSGTTLKVALDLNRRAVGIELNPDYLPLIERKCPAGRG